MKKLSRFIVGHLWVWVMFTMSSYWAFFLLPEKPISLLERWDIFIIVNGILPFVLLLQIPIARRAMRALLKASWRGTKFCGVILLRIFGVKIVDIEVEYGDEGEVDIIKSIQYTGLWSLYWLISVSMAIYLLSNFYWIGIFPAIILLLIVSIIFVSGKVEPLFGSGFDGEVDPGSIFQPLKVGIIFMGLDFSLRKMKGLPFWLWSMVPFYTIIIGIFAVYFQAWVVFMTPWIYIAAGWGLLYYAYWVVFRWRRYGFFSDNEYVYAIFPAKNWFPASSIQAKAEIKKLSTSQSKTMPLASIFRGYLVWDPGFAYGTEGVEGKFVPKDFVTRLNK